MPTPAYTDHGRALGWWIARSACRGLGALTILAGLAGLAGCSADGPTDTVRTQVALGSEPSIFGGARDDEASSSVVALKVARGGGFELCSGALVAPNVVLTARHCVARSITTTVSCDENGQSTNGDHVDGNQDPTSISVYATASPKFSREPDARGRAIVGPKSAQLCDTDIALVVLDRPLEGITPIGVRLNGGIAPGETVRTVGYGQNDERTPLGTRFKKPNVAVLAMGKGVSRSKTALGAHEFEVGLSICQGDSGGPAISETTGAVIGVVSRGSDCNVDFGHIYTTTAGWSGLFGEAFALAGGAPTLEAPVDPAAAPGIASGADVPSADSASCSASRPRGGSSSGAAVALMLACAVTIGARCRRASRTR